LSDKISHDASIILHPTFLWPFVIIALARFLFIYTQSEEYINSTYIQLILYGPAIVASVYWLIGDIDNYLVAKSWGWKVEILVTNPLVVLIAIWQVILGIICLNASIQYFLSLTSPVNELGSYKEKVNTEYPLITRKSLMSFYLLYLSLTI
jgi:hypothetical protein